MIKYSFSWLPELFLYDNKIPFEEYYEKVFEIFKKDFIDSRPIFNQKPVGMQKEPMVNGKPQTFYHMTTEDNSKTKSRIIAQDRCERIKWNRAILESNYFGLKIFPEKRSKGRKNIVIWFSEKDYVIILRKATTYYVFITAYTIKYEHKKRSLQKSYETYKQQKPPQS